MGLRNQQRVAAFSAKAATGESNSILVEDFRHINFDLATAGMGAGDSIVVKVQGSMSDDAPDFGASQSVSNRWDYIDCKDMEDTTDFDGDTGILLENADSVRQFSVNVDGLRWLALNVTTISDTDNTSISSLVKLFND